VARDVDSKFAQPAPKGVARSNPLDNTREPRMGRLAAVPLAALAVFAGLAWLGHEQVEQTRIRAVAKAVTASGYAGPVEVKPIRGDECWRAREGFAWKTADAAGWACAGPGGEVRLQSGRR
jgi:hypothetical protein